MSLEFSTRTAPLLAFLIGIASHVFYFRVGEHHLLPAVYLQLFSLACVASTICLTNLAGASLLGAIVTVSGFAGSWLAGVFGSLIVYRLFFHRLNKFPGPWAARIGALWLTSQMRSLQGYYVIQELHQRYGPFVRVSSNTLSITDPRMMPLAYGTHSKVIKADWYDGEYPRSSLHTTRDPALHQRRRRVWAPAFSEKALRGYEGIIQKFNDELVERIGESEGKSVNATTWFNLWSFDIMGALSFGKDYGMLESGERHWALDLLTEGLEIVGLKLPVWFLQLAFKIPGAAADYHKFWNFCINELKSRVQNQTSDKDIVSWFLQAYTDVPHPEDHHMLQADTRTLIIGGSDTTSATMTYLFYNLAKHPAHVERLRNELRPLTTGDWTDKDIQNAQHLNGVINEALRLHPPVPSGVKRKTPREGLRVGDVFVPGEVDFFNPQYVMGRDENNYVDAEAFVPERWYSKPDMIKHPDAFAPFSLGHSNCIGQNLARMELRTATTQLLLKYDVAFVPGEDGTRLMTETKDHFTLSLGQLDLVFKPIST